MIKLLRLAILLMVLQTTFAVAQSYPNRPVKIVVPYPPGGSADATMRPIAAKLSAALGQPFVIDNRGGAQSIIGAEIVAKATPDGYTLLVMPGALVLSPHLVKKVPFNVVRDFTPVAMMVTQPYVIVGSPSQPFKTLKDMVALARSSPDKLSIGTTDPLGILSVQALNRTAKIDLQQISYKGAGGGVVTDVLAGHIQLAITSPAGFMAMYKERRVNVLAVTGTERLPTMPDVPTVAEALGDPSYNFGTWFALVGPAGMPSSVVDKLQGELAKIVAEKDIRETLNGLGMTPARDSTPARTAETIKSDSERLGKLMATSGLIPE